MHVQLFSALSLSTLVWQGVLSYGPLTGLIYDHVKTIWHLIFHASRQDTKTRDLHNFSFCLCRL